jgi:hypothetical protein
LTVVGGATVAHIRRPLPRKAAVAADMVHLPSVTHSGQSAPSLLYCTMKLLM